MMRLSQFRPGTRVFLRPADRWVGVEVLDRPGADLPLRVSVVWTNEHPWLRVGNVLEVAADELTLSRVSVAEVLWRAPSDDMSKGKDGRP
jgi:hypothetical protein